jgi:hypothetical protein
VIVSLIGIASGFAVLFGLFRANGLDGWTALFMATTAATSASGFLFPIMAGAWRKIYVINAMIALYLNCFVLIAQLFRRVPFLTARAPTQSEPPFAVAQGVLVLAFVILTIMAASGSAPPLHTV